MIVAHGLRTFATGLRDEWRRRDREGERSQWSTSSTQVAISERHAAELSGFSPRRLRAWDGRGLVGPSIKRRLSERSDSARRLYLGGISRPKCTATTAIRRWWSENVFAVMLDTRAEPPKRSAIVLV
ncbi:MAG TPA: hypothetical protein VFZ70_15680 [Euzebyales bacterium]